VNERQIFLAALDIAALDERERFLDEICSGDAALRKRVEHLLKSHEEAGSFLSPGENDGSLADTGDYGAATDVDRVGAIIGPYKLLQEIGEGGMGTVYLAEQFEPIRRKVALKVINPGMDSQQVIARFEAERQALALMDHNNIARVYDAGTTQHGLPYFVMELIKGVPITEYCDSNMLTPRQRIELFIPVCDAVQHAHQKGIIHRDIKPGNVLVTLYDGKPVAKVIDFGIAKATGGQLTEKTIFTQIGQIVGTLQYMSPEQAEINQLDVDTRSDIYSLGVVLYELLTGTTPVTAEQLRSSMISDVLRTIREVEPPVPSIRLSDSFNALPAISAARKVAPAQLTRFIRGELDWIVMTSLEKDRARRYATAQNMGEDLRRFLAGEPVLARPPSVAYRLQKLALKHRVLVTAAAMLLALLVSATVVSLVLLKRESIARGRAENAEIKTSEALVESENARKAADKTIDFMVNAFSKSSPQHKDGAATVVETIDETLDLLQRSGPGEPQARARLYVALGRTLDGLGFQQKAHAALKKGHELWVAEKGENSREALEAALDVARTAGFSIPVDQHIELVQKSYKQLKALLGARAPATIDAMELLAGLQWIRKSPADSIRLYREVYKARREVDGANSSNYLRVAAALGNHLMIDNQEAEAGLLLDEVIDQLGKPEQLDSGALEASGRIVDLCIGLQREKAAIELLEAVQQPMAARFGPAHVTTLNAKEQLGYLYYKQGKKVQGLKLLEETYQTAKAHLEPKNSLLSRAHAHLTEIYRIENKPERLAQLNTEFGTRLPGRMQQMMQAMQQLGKVTSFEKLQQIYRLDGEKRLVPRMMIRMRMRFVTDMNRQHQPFIDFLLAEGMNDPETFEPQVELPNMVLLLAEAYGKAGRPKEGLALMEEWKESLPTTGMKYLFYKQPLAETRMLLQYKSGNFDEAMKIAQQQADEAPKAMLFAGGDILAQNLLPLAMMQVAAGKLPAAAATIKRLEAIKRSDGVSNWGWLQGMILALKGASESHEQQPAAAAAESMLLRGYIQLQQSKRTSGQLNYSPWQERFVEQRIAMFYQQTGRPGLASTWTNRLQP